MHMQHSSVFKQISTLHVLWSDVSCIAEMIRLSEGQKDVHSGALTNVPSNDLLGCKDCISAASVLLEGRLVKMWKAGFCKSWFQS